MKFIFKIIGYILAFIFILPQISKAMDGGQIETIIILYILMVILIDATGALYEWMKNKYEQRRGVLLGNESPELPPEK